VSAADQIAREILTAHWTAFERGTPEASRVYAGALGRVEDPETATEVLDAMARLAVTAIALNAASRGIAYEAAMADLFRHVDEAREG